MKRSLAVVLTCCALTGALGLAACGGGGGSSSGGAESQGAAPADVPAEGTDSEGTEVATEEKALPANRYTMTDEIIDGEPTDYAEGSLVIYQDGSGVLDIIYDQYPFFVDQEKKVLYLSNTDEEVSYAEEDDSLTVTLAEGYVFVFGLEERGFDELQPSYTDVREAAKAAQQAELETAYEGSSLVVGEDGWYHITTPLEFLHIADDLSGKYVLEDDIQDWSGGKSTVFSPLGTMDEPFTGELDGNGHMISSTLALSGEDEAWGIFGCNAGTIKNLTIGFMRAPEMEDRYDEADESEYDYATVEELGLPVDKTQYYGLLCGYNKGTIEDITLDTNAEMPIPFNENEHMCVGFLCGANAGTIRGVVNGGDSSGGFLSFRTLDKDTAAAVGFVCGYQTADGVLEDVTLNGSSTRIENWVVNENLGHAVYAGLLVGEAEGGTTIGGDIKLGDYLSVDADYSLAGQDLRLGGLVGWVHGDVSLSGISIDDLKVRIDARTNQAGYEHGDTSPLACAGLVGWADGSVALSDIELSTAAVNVIRRETHDAAPCYAGGFVGYCGGDLLVRTANMTGRNIVCGEPECGDAYAGGVCGYLAGNADVSNSSISVLMNPIFNGSTLFEANMLGYLRGNGTFDNVKVDCGTDDITGELMGHMFYANSDSTYYLASMAGCAEGEVTVSNSDIAVDYTLLGTPGAYYYDTEGDNGFYNRPQ